MNYISVLIKLVQFIYAEFSAAYEFQPVAAETHAPMDEATILVYDRLHEVLTRIPHPSG